MIPSSLRSLLRLSTPTTARRAWLIAGLTLVERLLTPAAAWLVLGGTLASQIIVSVVLGAVFTVRSLVQRTFAVRTETDFFVRVVDVLLESDVLRTSVLPDEDAHLELGQAIYNTSQAISQQLSALAADLVASAVLAVVVLAIEPPRVVAAAVGLTLVGLAVVLVSRRSLQKAAEKAWKAQERVYSAFVDALDGRLEIVAAGRRVEFMKGMTERARVWAREAVRVAADSVISGRLPLAAMVVVVAAAILVAGSQWRASFSVSVSDVALLVAVTPAFAGVAQGVLALARNEHWVAIVTRILGAPRVTHRGTRPPPEHPARIAFEGISFRYDTATSHVPDALHDISFLHDSPILALAGPNGSGKSTCLRLLLGLGIPHSGRITVDGIPLADLDIETWRSRVAFLPQRPYLPPRSDLRTAIRFLAPDATDDAILHALDRVGLLTSLRRSSPSPLSVPVDSLSVGQRQRVGLARLLCCDAALYLLDEPDANLDRDGIALVADVVRELGRDRSVILAAHTPELLELAKQVIRLDEGRLVASPGSMSDSFPQ
jgi:ATP-binding cassette subfamily C protein CydCD